MIPIPPGLEHYGIAVAAHLTVEAAHSVKAAFKKLSSKRPDLETRAAAAQVARDRLASDRVFADAVGAILAEAAAGTIQIDGAALEALRSAKFDHQHGTVTIANTTIKAPIVETGGSAGATGQTHISGTVLQSQGTKIDVGQNAAIIMSGGAKIIQT